MKIKISQNRTVERYGTEGTEQENKVVIMEFEFPEEIQDYVKYIEFEIDENNKVFDWIQNDTYTLKTAITKYQEVKAQIVAKKDDDVWKSKMFDLKFNKSINANHEIEDEEEIDVLNEVIQRVDAIEDDIEELNEKIEHISGYDDTEVRELIQQNTDSINELDINKQEKLIAGENITIENNVISATGGGSGGTSDYPDLNNKPSINNVELVGNKSLNDLGIQPKGNYALRSEIPDVSNFITNSVNNLINYYLKSETYTKTEVNNLIGQIATLQFQVVNELPQTGDSKYIYLVPSANPKTKNVKDEYIWTNNAWEQIGSTQVDLTGYATESWVNTQISGFLTQAQIEALITTALTGYAKTEDLPTKTSDLTNDSGFITGYTETDPVFSASASAGITSTDIANWNNKSNFSGSYNDLTDKPNIPDELSDLSDDSMHRTVTDAEKTLWNNKSDFSGDYNDLSNKPTIPTVPTNVSAFTNDAGYLTSHQDISGKEDKTNKVTSISSSSTDTQYPSAKCVYDLIGDVESILTTLTTGGGVA